MLTEGPYRVPFASRGTVLIPLDAGRVRGGMWLYGAVRPSAVKVQKLSGWLAGLSVYLIPGSTRETWRPPLDLEALNKWLAQVEDVAGAKPGHAVFLLPRDSRRRRFSILLLDKIEAPMAFAKFTMNEPNRLALDAMRRFASPKPRPFWAPILLDSGKVGSYSFTLTTTMPNQSHTPAKLSPLARRNIVTAIQQDLEHLAHDGAVIAHGDFGAWNVRTLRDRSIAIVDWEETTTAVAAADELWHVLSWGFKSENPRHIWSIVDRELPNHDRDAIGEAARFWLDRLARPEPTEVDPAVAMKSRLKSASDKTLEALGTLAIPS